MSTLDNRFSRFLFYFLLLVITWLPLPYGSKPEWAMGILQAGVFMLSAFWLAGYGFGHLSVTPAFRKGAPVYIGLLLVAFWVWVQSLPLPAELVQQLSPVAWSVQVEAASALNLPVPDALYLSLDPFASQVHALLSLAYALLFAMVLLLVSDPKRLRVIAWVFVIAGAFQALFGSLSTLSGAEVLLFGPKETGQGVASGTFVNRNSFSGCLEMTLAVGMGLLLGQLNERRFHDWHEFWQQTLKTLLSNKVILRTAIAIMVVGLVMGRSRMGNTAFFSSLMITGVLYVICRKKLTRGVVILFVSLFVIDTIIVSQWFGLEEVVERLERTNVQTEARSDVNPQTIGAIPDFALAGSGAGSFYTTLPQYHDGTWRGFFDLAHNDFLQFPLEFGVPAYAILGLMVLFTAWQAIQAMRLRRNMLMVGMGFAAFMGILAIMIHSSVDFNLQIPSNAAYFVCMMALGWLARYLPTLPGASRHPLPEKDKQYRAC
ncbi:O-antigen ligase family protein [Thalassotalea sp. G20_0]|uniref:O-antigen ligase family protein n=1 Tax=Thalassotalea sp. G20_0 TaxID=2821093 RepID=UPI001AD98353|nr:O-antigen ligase family protein [Thalassotalea sp. G20_0]MBO9497082.1 O-antigen ligase family protein [Thalassotalea sp. G20_0]